MTLEIDLELKRSLKSDFIRRSRGLEALKMSKSGHTSPLIANVSHRNRRSDEGEISDGFRIRSLGDSAALLERNKE